MLWTAVKFSWNYWRAPCHASLLSSLWSLIISPEAMLTGKTPIGQYWWLQNAWLHNWGRRAEWEHLYNGLSATSQHMPGTFPMIIRGFLPGCLNVSLCYLSLHAAYFRTGNFPCVTTCRQSLVNLYFLPIRQSRKFSGPQQRKPRNSEVWKNILYNSSKNQKLVYAQSFSGWQAEVGHPITGQ